MYLYPGLAGRNLEAQSILVSIYKSNPSHVSSQAGRPEWGVTHSLGTRLERGPEMPRESPCPEEQL